MAVILPYLGKGGGKRVVVGLHKKQVMRANGIDFQARIHSFAARHNSGVSGGEYKESN